MANGTLTTGKLVLTDTTTNTDSFDRLRVSEPQTLFEINHVLNGRTRTIDEISTGSGTILHNSNSYVQMSLSDSGTGSNIRQSYEYIPYQPGKSRLMLFTGVLEVLNGGVSGVTSRIGCFDDAGNKTIALGGSGNGLFFELVGTDLYVVERLINSNTAVIQSSWNFDVFDGSGNTSTNPSGLLVNDYSKAMIFGIDQQWLGVGVSRFGFMINGVFRIGHIFYHSGIGSNPTSTAITQPYIKTAKLPIRYEIISSSPANAEMRMICASVISEGGYKPIGDPFSNCTVNATSLGDTLTYTPIISIRLIEVEPFIRNTAILNNIVMLNTTNSSYANWRLYLLQDDSQLVGESFSNISINSSVQVDESATGIILDSNSYLLASGFVEKQSSTSFAFGENYISAPIINASIRGKSRILTLAGTKITGTPTVYGSINWLEIF